MKKINVLKIIGIDDSNKVEIKYNDGFFEKAELFFDGNGSFMEEINSNEIEVTTLYLGGERQFEKLILNKKPDLAINTICDPEIQKKSLNVMENLNLDFPIINPSKGIKKTARDILSHDLPSYIHNRIIVPKTYRIRPQSVKDILDSAYCYFKGKPFLFRPVCSHGGERLIKVHNYNTTDFNAFVINGESQYFITEYIDFCRDGVYQKMRFFVIDGKVHPRHLISSKCWNIHSQTRDEFSGDTFYQNQEKDFLSDYPFIFDELCKSIHEFTQLDFFGVDCALTDDLKIVLFEANVCMRPFANHNQEYLKTSNTIIQNNLLGLLRKRLKDA